MASSSTIKFSDPAVNLSAHDQRTRLVPARQVYITSKWATGPILEYLLSGDATIRENSLFKIDSEITPTTGGQAFLQDFPGPYKNHDIEDFYERVIEPKKIAASFVKLQHSPNQVQIWTKKPKDLKAPFKPSLMSLI